MGRLPTAACFKQGRGILSHDRERQDLAGGGLAGAR
jgi:hypothetical protein